MKKLLTIKGIFNDVFTNYEDKEDFLLIEVDLEKDCTCTPFRKCWLCKNIEEFGLTDLPEKKELTIKTN